MSRGLTKAQKLTYVNEFNKVLNDFTNDIIISPGLDRVYKSYSQYKLLALRQIERRGDGRVTPVIVLHGNTFAFVTMYVRVVNGAFFAVVDTKVNTFTFLVDDFDGCQVHYFYEV